MNIHRINKWFEKRANGVIKYRWIWLITFFVVLGVSFNGMKYIKISTSWDDYFLEDDPILVKTEEFKEIFGNDNYLAVLTRTENTFTKENLKLIRELSDELKDSIQYADKVTSLTDIEFLRGTEYGMQIEQIVPDEIPSDKASLDSIRAKAYFKKNLANRLISKDGKLSWILLKLLPFPTGSNATERKERIKESPEIAAGREVHHIISKDKYKAISPIATGMPYISYAKTQWYAKEGSKTMGIAILLAIVVLIFVTKSVRGVVVPVLTSIASIVIVYGILGYVNYKIDAGMMTIPMLLAFAIAIAYNIHFFTYFKRQFLISGNRKQAVVETIAEMGWPILFSALTTLSALLSFLVIRVIPLHFVGIATSSCVLVTFLIVIVVMPIALSFGKDKAPNPSSEEGGKWDQKLSFLGDWVLRKGNAILTVFILLVLFLIYGATKIQTAFDIEKTMGRNVPYVNDLLTVSKSELGSLYSYDILIEFPKENEAKLPQNLDKLDSLSAYVKTFPLTKRTTSILNILKDLNQTLNENKEQFYRIANDKNKIAQMLLLYENAGGSEAEYWIDYDYKRLRLMVELENYNSSQAEKELAEVSEFAKKLFPNAKVTTVGALPQFTAMMQYVVRGQLASLAVAFVIITILLIFVFGSFKIGLIGLVPNIFPAIVVGGIMGWTGMPLDMMTATIIPMILGLAVDDTIHFINHGHLEFDRQRNYKSAIKRSFFVVGTPIIFTTIIISSNFAVYMTSDAISIFNMGILSVAGMFSALFSDLFITPILFKKFQIFGKEYDLKTSN